MHPVGPAAAAGARGDLPGRYDRLPTTAVTFSRRNVAKRDHYTCQYCGAQPGWEAITIDHVVPRSQGGASSWTNCVAACVAVQRPQGRPDPRAGRHAAPAAPVRPTGSRSTPRTGPGSQSWSKFLADEPALRPGLNRPNPPRPRRPGPLTGVCSWESSSLQNSRTGFESLRPCCRMDALGVCRSGTRPSEGRETRFDSWRGHPRMTR